MPRPFRRGMSSRVRIALFFQPPFTVHRRSGRGCVPRWAGHHRQLSVRASGEASWPTRPATPRATARGARGVGHVRRRSAGRPRPALSGWLRPRRAATLRQRRCRCDRRARCHVGVCPEFGWRWWCGAHAGKSAAEVKASSYSTGGERGGRGATSRRRCWPFRARAHGTAGQTYE